MADQAPSFETQDVLGTTQHYNGTVGTTPILLPTTAGAKISTFLIRNPMGNGAATTIFVAADGQLTYISVTRGEAFQWSPKKTAAGSPITQIRIYASANASTYEAIMDFEP